NACTANATNTLTLTNGVVVTEAPAITSGTSTTFGIGMPGSFTVTATGSPAPTFSESGALPSGVTFNTTTHVLSGTPANGTAGTYPISITATNSQGSNTQPFTLTVKDPTTVTINQAVGQADRTNASPIHYTAVYRA